MSADDEEPMLPPEVPPELRAPGLLARARRHVIDLTPLRESRDFRRLFVGQWISEFGSQITAVAVPFQVYRITGSTLAVGLIALCELVPLLTLSIIGGAVADAVERRRMLLGSHVVLVFLSLGLAANAHAAHPRLWILYAFSAVSAALYALYSPAVRTWPSRLVSNELLPSVFALEATYYNVDALAGPALGGVLIAGIGLSGAYVVDVASFLAALVSLWLMRPSPPAREDASVGMESIREGLRFLRGKRVLQSTFTVDLNAMVFGMPRSLMPAVTRRLGGGPRVLGLLYAAPRPVPSSRCSSAVGSGACAGKGSRSWSPSRVGARAWSRSGSRGRSGSRSSSSRSRTGPTW